MAKPYALVEHLATEVARKMGEVQFASVDGGCPAEKGTEEVSTGGAWDDVNIGWELPADKVRAARLEEVS